MALPSPASKPDPAEFSKMALNALKALQPSTPVQKLMAVGQKVVTNPDFVPSEGKTYCNFGLCQASVLLKGYQGFKNAQGTPLMANDMIRVMATDSKHWGQASGQDAWDNALMGGLSVACVIEQPHGHVAVVAPTARVWSAKWSAYVPPVYNVGKTMNLQAPYTIGEGFAFILRPTHYIYVD